MLEVKEVIERYESTREYWSSRKVGDTDYSSWSYISQALFYARAAELFEEELTTLKKGWNGELPYSEIEEQLIGTFLCGDGKHAGEQIHIGRKGQKYLKQDNILGIVLHGAVSLRKCDFYDVEKWARYIKMADAHNDFVDAILEIMKPVEAVEPMIFFQFVVRHSECREILDVHVEKMREMLSDLAECYLQEVGI